MAKNSVAHILGSGMAPALSAPFFDMAPLRELKAGAVLFAAGDTGDGCYRLEQGLLKVMVTSPSGEERIIAILGPGTIVGELAMIDRLPRSASVVALRDSVLRFVSRETFEKSVNAHPKTYQALVAILASRLLAAATFLTVKARVARSSSWRNSSESRPARDASCSTKRSVTAISRPWPVWRGKT